MTQRDYRTAANSPAGAIADSDVFTHNASGQTLTANSGRYNNQVAMTYDVAGRLQDESLTISGQTYTVGNQYDARGQLWKQTYPSGKVAERLYHDEGQLHQVKFDSSLVDTRLYDDGGRLDNSTYGNGVVTDFTYFDDNMLQSIATTNPGANKVGTYAYTWDANKNKLTETITGSPLATKSFSTSGGTDPDGYDDEDRLVYWKHTDNSLTHDWTLTAVGDWSNFKVNGTGTARTHSNTHEILTVGAQSLVHDVKGNLTINANGDEYAWDFDNRMSGADTDGNTVDDVLYEYDALGRRVRKNNGTANTVYVLTGWQVIAEYESGAAPASPSEQFVYASYIDEPILKAGTGGSVYYLRNRQYSITTLTNSTGSAVERYAYDSHGKLAIFNASTTPISATQYANPFTYTGRQFEPETGLYYFRARYFDSVLGRFIGRDPIGYVPGDLNMFRYVRNTPLRLTDPFGLDDEIKDLSRLNECMLECGLSPETATAGEIASLCMRRCLAGRDGNPTVDDRGHSAWRRTSGGAATQSLDLSFCGCKGTMEVNAGVKLERYSRRMDGWFQIEGIWTEVTFTNTGDVKACRDCRMIQMARLSADHKKGPRELEFHQVYWGRWFVDSGKGSPYYDDGGASSVFQDQISIFDDTTIMGTVTRSEKP